MTIESTAARSYYPGLDLLRFGAALMIVFYHLLYLVWMRI